MTITFSANTRRKTQTQQIGAKKNKGKGKGGKGGKQVEEREEAGENQGGEDKSGGANNQNKRGKKGKMKKMKEKYKDQVRGLGFRHHLVGSILIIIL